MIAPIQGEHFTKALSMLLDETFDHVNGYYLDEGTSLFETLATISAEEASIPVGGRCATLAAQVKHVAFYLEVLERSLRSGTFERVDWNEIWRTTKEVTPGEWEVLQSELRERTADIHTLIIDMPAWPSEREIGEILAVITHSAYHLGEIRQALCTIKQ